MLDLLLTRYSNINFILDLPLLTGIGLINKCYEEVIDEKLWEMWLAIYPNMDKESFISFEDFKNKALERTKQKQGQTTEEMISMAKMLNAAFGGEVVEV